MQTRPRFVSWFLFADSLVLTRSALYWRQQLGPNTSVNIVDLRRPETFREHADPVNQEHALWLDRLVTSVGGIPTKDALQDVIVQAHSDLADGILVGGKDLALSSTPPTRR